MSHSAIAVFTGKTIREIFGYGGSRSWLLSPRHARSQRYLVCVRNAQTNDPDATEAHRSAFLIGIISGILRLEANDGVPRWQISISNYALIDVPGAWHHWRNPVRYTSLEELGISLDGLAFAPLPVLEHALDDEATAVQATPVASSARKLTIAEAKQGLAAMFGVSPDAVEITIKG